MFYLHYTNESGELQLLTGKLKEATVSLIDTPVKNFIKARGIQLSIQPMCCAIGITAHLIIDGVTSQDTSQIQIIRDLTLLMGTGMRERLGQTENHQRMQFGKRYLQNLPRAVKT